MELKQYWNLVVSNLVKKQITCIDIGGGSAYRLETDPRVWREFGDALSITSKTSERWKLSEVHNVFSINFLLESLLLHILHAAYHLSCHLNLTTELLDPNTISHF